MSSVREIAEALNNHERWRSHGRGISMATLQNELKLKIDDFGATPSLATAVKEYWDFVVNCMVKENLVSFVTSREFA